MVAKTGTTGECIDELINVNIMAPGKNVTYVQHHFTQYYQNEMYKDCKESLKGGDCLMVQDFSQNRKILHQNEIKSAHWSQKQVSMHPTVLFYKTEDDQDVKKMVITHLSDIANHDAHLVHYMTKDCIDTLSKMHTDVKWNNIYLWSDGCASQYKGKHSFFYLDQYGTNIQRNFFGSEHGKGESDAQTGVFSKQLSDAVKSENYTFKNAQGMCDFLSSVNDVDCRKFVLVNENDLKSTYQRFENVKVSTLSGKCTRSLHQIKPSDEKGVLLTQRFSCFCYQCLTGMYDQCLYKDYTLGNFID